MLKTTRVSTLRYEFGPFQLFPGARKLVHAGQRLRLGDRAFDLLLLLVQHEGHPVPKDALLAAVWPGTVIDAAALRVHFSAVRKVLDHDRQSQSYIVNVAQQGYRISSPVRAFAEQDPAEQRGDWRHSTADRAPQLFGRDPDIGAVGAHLQARSCLTIIGPGGIGKTSLALAVVQAQGQRYPDGVRVVDLASIADMACVPALLQTALGLDDSTDVSLALPDAIEHIAAALNERRMLILLDNCEHLVEAAALFAEKISVHAPYVQLLCTSREPLRTASERLYQLSSLSWPRLREGDTITAGEAMRYSAVAMFAWRCGAHMQAASLCEQEMPTVVGICERLDGIPLALELAAARVEDFGLRGLAAMLAEGFDVLTRGHRTAPPRHRTMREAIAWSYRLLSEEEKKIFCLAGLFGTTFTEITLSQLYGGDALALLGDLVSKSLLSATFGSDGLCYRMQDAARNHAVATLRETGGLAAARQLLAELQPHLAGSSPGHGPPAAAHVSSLCTN